MWIGPLRQKLDVLRVRGLRSLAGAEAICMTFEPRHAVRSRARIPRLTVRSAADFEQLEQAMGKLKVLTLIVVSAAFASPLEQAQAQRGAPSRDAPFERICSDQGGLPQQIAFAQRLVERLHLNDAQKAAFKDFQDARAKSLNDSKAKLCDSKPDLSSFEGRLVFGQTFLEARLEALKAENPKLIAFYNSLDARQKKQFDYIREHFRR